ncbi:unnamed protein product [Euphydryas editha]|uniref:Uncharacterized protein n=1 Tax=Euphydryas editha TaxID=104508 RepID=A0AAU9TPN2_EUPED|nr:unnamed protein product [Euphydryas editha]
MVYNRSVCLVASQFSVSFTFGSTYTDQKMKLFVIAALIAVASAARLDHLERSYLPPDNNNGGFNSNGGAKGFGSNAGSRQNGFGAFGSASGGNDYNSASNGFGHSSSKNQLSNGHNFGSNGLGVNGHSSNGFGSASGSNGFGANGHSSNGFGPSRSSNGFGANGHGSNGFGSSQSLNGFGFNAGAAGKNSAFPGATSNQYLPPDHGPSAGEFEGFSGNGVSSQSSPTRFTSQQYNQGSQYSNLDSVGSYSGSSHGSASGTFGSQGSFGSQPQFGAASRQYLAPKTSSFQNIPQQAFDEQTGYHY